MTQVWSRMAPKLQLLLAVATTLQAAAPTGLAVCGLQALLQPACSLPGVHLLPAADADLTLCMWRFHHPRMPCSFSPRTPLSEGWRCLLLCTCWTSTDRVNMCATTSAWWRRCSAAEITSRCVAVFPNCRAGAEPGAKACELVVCTC